MFRAVARVTWGERLSAQRSGALARAVPGGRAGSPTQTRAVGPACGPPVVAPTRNLTRGNRFSLRSPTRGTLEDVESTSWEGAMTEIQKYLAEEVAEDHADGIITRREAMRRLGLLGVGAAAASSMLAAASAQAASGRRQGGGGHHQVAGARSSWAPVATQPITFAGPRCQTLMAAWAPATKPRGGVLVIHENRGLTDHIRNVAGRLAASGWSALALDLLSEEGGTGAFPGEAEVAAKLGQPARRSASTRT